MGKGPLQPFKKADCHPQSGTCCANCRGCSQSNGSDYVRLYCLYSLDDTRISCVPNGLNGLNPALSYTDVNLETLVWCHESVMCPKVEFGPTETVNYRGTFL